MESSALLAAWDRQPHPRLSALLEALPAPAPFMGDVDAWCAAARKVRGEGRWPFVQTLFHGALGDVARKLDVVATWRDARLCAELARVLGDPPWSSNASRPVWARVFALVASSRDPRFHALAQALPARWALRSAQKAWMTQALRDAVATVPPLRELEAELAARLHGVERDAFAARPARARPSATIDFAAVYAAPADDAPRRVLADALLEAGDPRGELLALQLRGASSVPDRRAEKALLAVHGKAWLAPFGTALGAKVTWRRGFPAQGLVKLRDARDVARFGQLAEWATFEALEWAPARSREHVEAAGFIGPAFRHLLRADGAHLPLLLAPGAGPFALRVARGVVGGPAGLDALLESPALPHLEALHVRDADFTPQWVRQTKRWGQVRELGVAMTYPPSLLQVLAAAQDAGLARLRWGDALCFHRDDAGALARLELLDPHGSYRVDEQLAQLPPGVVREVLTPLPQAAKAGWRQPVVDRLLASASAGAQVSALAARHLDVRAPVTVRFVSPTTVLVGGRRQVRWVDLASLEVTRRHDEPLRDVAAGPGALLRCDGARVTRLADDGGQRVLLEGKKLWQLQRSGDGRRAAVVEGARVRVFDAQTGAVLLEVRGESPALDEPGERLLVTVRQQLELHDVSTKSKRALEGWPFTPTFLADGRLARPGDGDVALVTQGDGGALLELPMTKGVTAAFASTREGTRVAVIQPSGTRVFDGVTGRLLRELPGALGGAFGPGGVLVLATEERALRFDS